MGVNLVGVVHEQKGVKEFQPYLNASIYFDEKVRPSGCCFFFCYSLMGFCYLQYFELFWPQTKISFQIKGNLACEQGHVEAQVCVA